MEYVMEKELVDAINTQRAEAIEFSKQPNCWMGMYVEPSDTKYWSERVPSGTLKEFNRINLEEDAYYAVADAYSKSYARSFDFASMTDAEVEKIFDDACESMERERKWEEQMKKEAIEEEKNLAKSLGIDVPTLQRWMKEAA
jgi:transcriptional regulator with PAS, ATPase and Fis domain